MLERNSILRNILIEFILFFDFDWNPEFIRDCKNCGIFVRKVFIDITQYQVKMHDIFHSRRREI